MKVWKSSLNCVLSFMSFFPARVEQSNAVKQKHLLIFTASLAIVL